MKFVFPGGLGKALTFSYDDGRDYDRKLVEILNQNGLKGTFHLNSGKFDREGYVASAEVPTLYAGHEVSCHGVEHKFPTALDAHRWNIEIGDDRRALEKISGQLVQGMSYAFGDYSKTVEDIAQANGLKYARTTKATKNFWLPQNFMEWHPTCHHNGMLELAEKFLNLAGFYELPVFYVWGHSYEFGIPDEWESIEQFAQMMAGKEDIWYATNLEICDYVNAVRAQEYSADGKIIKNPTATTVWFVENDKLVEVKSGEIKVIGE